LAVVAALCAVSVAIVGASPARADWQDDELAYWNKYMGPAFEPDETGKSAFDKVYGWIFGPDGVGIDPDADIGEDPWVECTPGPDKPWCQQIMAGYAPSPSGVTTMFAKAPAAAGVSIKAGNATVSGLGMVFDFLGSSASHLTVDTATTDLVVQEGAPPGWVGGDNKLGPLTVAVVTAPAAGTAGTVTYSVTRSFCGATWNTSSQCFKDVFGTGNQGQWEIKNYNAAGTQLSGGVSGSVFGLGSITSNYTVTQTFTVASGWNSFRVTSAGPGVVAGFPSETIRYCAPGTGCYTETPGGLIGSVESTYQCRQQDGDTRTVTASVAVSGTGQVPVDLPSFNCAADELLIGALVEWVTDTGRQTIYDYEAPSWVQDTPAEWQDCGTKNCELKLYKDGQYCGENAVGCLDWWESDPEGYTCKFGSHVVDLNYCAIYREPGKKSPTGKITVASDGTPEYEDPKDKPREWFDTLPKAPGADPVTPPAPDPGPIAPGRGDVTSSTGPCFPSGWGVFNPLEWVYRPVTCALSWAFVPRPAQVQAQLDVGRAALEGNGILSVVPAAASVPGEISEGWAGGCSSSLGDFEVTTSAGTWSASLPCDVGDVAPAWSSQYSGFYGFATVAVLASGAWGMFMVVRRYFGSKDGGDE